ncbi:MAG TPA: tetratricopeptide repeat protein, partial [Thermoanaerobaculia bacterium]|nr:tetratricopeptide repeat protein [Thermoanaerobaculia bacterium]
GATALVTGRVQRLGSTIVVAADLVRTADGSQLWGERFQRPFSDIFTVQEQIATSISDQLRLQLTTAERRKLAQRPTRRSDAYELYLKGRYHLNRRTADSAGPALAAFEQAVDVDPQYALAWAGIAEAHLWRRFLSSDADASDELCVLAERAARKAAALDPALADPHSTLGYLAMFRWDWRDAEREYRTALALNPDHANTHSWYSHLLMLMARREEALLEIRAAIEIEPLSHSLNVSYAGLLWVMGRNEQAEAVAKKVVELEPRFYFARWMMALASLARGHFEEAVTILERTVAECGQHPELLGTLGYAYARLDRKDEAMAILAEIDAVSHGKDHSHLAEVCLGLGDISAALRYAEHGFLKRGSINAILLTPQFAPLREDPRFEAMLARIGFPDPRQATFIPTTYQARAL